MNESHISQHAAPETPDNELRRILAAQEIETKWWGDQPTMDKEADIARALEAGWAVTVPAIGEGYKISANVRENFRVLDKNTFSVLQEVASNWLQELQSRQIKNEGLFLVISSLGRTTEFQKELIAQGFPAAENSTHTKLGAFDIAIKWFEQNRPELLETLTAVLQKISDEDRINFIEEPSVGAYHIGFNRTTIQ